MKKLLLVLLALVMTFTLASCGEDEEANTDSEKATYEWTVSSGLPVGSSWDQGLIKFDELLQEKSDGRMSLVIYSGGTLGGAKEALEGVQMGSIDMIVESSISMSNFTDAMTVYDLPYLFPDADTARTVLAGETAQGQLDVLEEFGFKGLNYWENGMLAIGSKEPIYEPADMAGLKIRSADNAVAAGFFENFDANAVVLTWGDIYTSLQNGVLDGVDSTTVPNMYSMNFYDVAPYIVETNHGYTPAPLMMNLDLWNSLSEEDQAIVMEAANEARDYHYEVCDEILSTCEADMEENGATIIKVDPSLFAPKVESMYDEFVGEDGIDPELVEKLQEEAEALK